MAQKKTAAADSSTLLDTNDVADRLKDVSPRTIERWRTSGKGPKFIKVGKRVLYRLAALERWLDQQTRSHTNESSARG